jgi:hypothetical protein
MLCPYDKHHGKIPIAPKTGVLRSILPFSVSAFQRFSFQLFGSPGAPFSPPSGPAHRLFQGLSSKSKFPATNGRMQVYSVKLLFSMERYGNVSESYKVYS